MRSPSLLSVALFALCLGGCPENVPDAGPAVPPAAPSGGQGLVARCSVRTERAPDDLGVEPVMAIDVGSTGVTVFTTGHEWSGSGVLPLVMVDGTSVATVPGGHVLAEQRTVSLLDAPTHRRRTTLTLARDAADAQVVATSEGLMLLFRRLDRTARVDDDEDPDNIPGALWFQRLDEAGRAAGTAVPLAMADRSIANVLWFTARWDAGRLVVSMQDAEAATRHAIVSPLGRVLAIGEGGEVVCPLAGCVRLVGRSDPHAGDVGALGDGLLRVQLLAHGTALATTLPADHIDVAAVSGDRALVVARSTVEGAVQRTVAVLDVPRHRLVPVMLTENQQLTTSWTLPLASATPYVSATAEGFVLVYDDVPAHIVRQDIVCDR